jgi:DNA (cytosine-5)-methyltransferase 1
VKPRLLDLFCGAGGAARGYQDAGFYVVGVDLEPQPDYCGDEFHRADALSVLGAIVNDRRGPSLKNLNAIHASPPCQAYTTMSNRHGRSDVRLIAEVRALLIQTGLPYVIENVAGARRELVDPVRLCGRSLGLPIHRHRLFETNFPVLVPPCVRGDDAFGIYGKLDGRRLWTRADGSEYHAAATLEEAQAAMEMPWADWHGVKEAIPPRYAEHIGHQLVQHLRAQVAA